MTDDHSQLVETALALRAAFCRSLRPASEWLEVDLTMSQLKILFLLSDEQHVSMTRLAEALHVTLATATGIVDRLVDHGWARRDEDPHDRRLVLCALTPEGQEIVDRLRQAGTSHLRRVLDHLSATELRRVVAGLELLCSAARADAADEQADVPQPRRTPTPAGARPDAVGSWHR